jgi:thymidine kinase
MIFPVFNLLAADNLPERCSDKRGGVALSPYITSQYRGESFANASEVFNNFCQFFCGPMYSGKTSKLIKNYLFLKRIDYVTIIITVANDKKSGVKMVASRDLNLPLQILNAEVEFDRSTNMLEVLNSFLNKYESKVAFLIDEAQFLTEKQAEDVCHAAKNLNFSINLFGLDYDFRRIVFEGTKVFLDSGIFKKQQMYSTCDRCGGKAVYTMRIDQEGKGVFEGEVKQIGDNYKAVCDECFSYFYTLSI